LPGVHFGVCRVTLCQFAELDCGDLLERGIEGARRGSSRPGWNEGKKIVLKKESEGTP
jgi:hypothetical protein